MVQKWSNFDGFGSSAAALNDRIVENDAEGSGKHQKSTSIYHRIEYVYSMPDRNRRSLNSMGEDRPYTFLKLTTALCPECNSLVQTRVIVENNRVYFLKRCPEHGQSRSLISEDAAYYQKSYRYGKPGSLPLRFSTPVKEGCPSDCGLCPDHQQHTCLPIIEITDHCNLACPICLVDNQRQNHMSVDDFRDIIDRLIEHEGTLESINLSGGEPTLHPEFFTLIDAATRPQIGRISVSTNGLRIAESEEFCRELKERNVYINLQFDGFDDEIYGKIRGEPLLADKLRAVDHLTEFNISTQLIFVPAKGINDHQFGEIIRLLLDRDNIISLLVQPLSYCGPGGSTFQPNPLDRITIPGAMRKIEEQTAGMIAFDDFIPLPCSHPQCVSLTYLLKMDDGDYRPFPRFVNMDEYLDLFSRTATLEPGPETERVMQDVIYRLWSSAGEIPDSDGILKCMKRALREMFPPVVQNRQELIRISERQAKTIFIHHYMDKHNFDLERVMKCCHHYPQIDGRIMPVCAHNMFYR